MEFASRFCPDNFKMWRARPTKSIFSFGRSRMLDTRVFMSLKLTWQHRHGPHNASPKLFSQAARIKALFPCEYPQCIFCMRRGHTIVIRKHNIGQRWHSKHHKKIDKIIVGWKKKKGFQSNIKLSNVLLAAHNVVVGRIKGTQNKWLYSTYILK